MVLVIIAACAERDTYWMASQLAKSYNRNKKSRKRLSCQRNRNKALSYWTFTVCARVRACMHACCLIMLKITLLVSFYLPSPDDHVIQHPGTIKGFAHCRLQCRACLPAQRHASCILRPLVLQLKTKKKPTYTTRIEHGVHPNAVHWHGNTYNWLYWTL